MILSFYYLTLVPDSLFPLSPLRTILSEHLQPKHSFLTTRYASSHYPIPLYLLRMSFLVHA